jgi:hypothetical protein
VFSEYFEIILREFRNCSQIISKLFSEYFEIVDDVEPLHDQANQPTAVYEQPFHPADDQQNQPVVDVPAVSHRPDPPDLDQDQPRRSRIDSTA